MEEEGRGKIVKEFLARPFPCQQHPHEVANIFYFPE